MIKKFIVWYLNRHNNILHYKGTVIRRFTKNYYYRLMESGTRSGKWIKENCQGDYGHCSECNCRIPWIPQNYTYCPKCGAKNEQAEFAE